MSNHFKILYTLILIIVRCQQAISLYLECKWGIPFVCSAENKLLSNTTELTLKSVDFDDHVQNTVTFNTIDEFRTIFANLNDVTIFNATELLDFPIFSTCT